MGIGSSMGWDKKVLHKCVGDISSCLGPYPKAACPKCHVGCRLGRELFTLPMYFLKLQLFYRFSKQSWIKFKYLSNISLIYKFLLHKIQSPGHATNLLWDGILLIECISVTSNVHCKVTSITVVFLNHNPRFHSACKTQNPNGMFIFIYHTTVTFFF